jgi:hypothetical protein
MVAPMFLIESESELVSWPVQNETAYSRGTKVWYGPSLSSGQYIPASGRRAAVTLIS